MPREKFDCNRMVTVTETAADLFARLVELARASRQGRDAGLEIEATVWRLIGFQRAHPECGVRTVIHAQSVAE